MQSTSPVNDDNANVGFRVLPLLPADFMLLCKSSSSQMKESRPKPPALTFTSVFITDLELTTT